jgi:hypothetical protein
MAQERVHKKIKIGTLVKLNHSQEYGIVFRVKINWYSSNRSPFSYGVLVKGTEVSAGEEGLTVIGEL